MAHRGLAIAVAFRRHWPEYALEALELGLFMVSASIFAILLFHPASPAVHIAESETLRRLLMGIAMGLTAIAIIYSPMGQRSGAHMNPATTLTFWRLGKIEHWDAAFYIGAQFVGAILGMTLMSALLGDYLRHQSVHYVATIPGMAGFALAWAGEFTIAFVLMLMVLNVSNRKSIAQYTGVFAGCLVAAYIFIEAPLSGMSMNPARTFGSSLASHLWTGLWIYFTAPPLAMLLASEVYLRVGRDRTVYCAKLNHFNSKPCIFRCRFHEMIDTRTSRIISELPAPLKQRPQPIVDVHARFVLHPRAASCEHEMRTIAADTSDPNRSTHSLAHHTLYFG
jgi:aquaporin Z